MLKDIKELDVNSDREKLINERESDLRPYIALDSQGPLLIFTKPKRKKKKKRESLRYREFIYISLIPKLLLTINKE